MISQSYASVTELPGLGATREQLSMLYTRYKFAQSFCDGKEVLEIACGAGQALGYLARVAKRVVGGDIDEDNLKYALGQYQGREHIDFRQLDAHNLPFSNESFDVIILFEAIYYLEGPDQFLEECHRILRKGGILLISTVNKEWSDFNPSPFSTRYFSAKELHQLLGKHGFEVELYGAFSVERSSTREIVTSLFKKVAIKLRLMPRTMKGKEFLKRIFLGKLIPIPSEVIDGMAEYNLPQSISNGSQGFGYKVLYAVGYVKC